MNVCSHVHSHVSSRVWCTLSYACILYHFFVCDFVYFAVQYCYYAARGASSWRPDGTGGLEKGQRETRVRRTRQPKRFTRQERRKFSVFEETLLVFETQGQNVPGYTKVAATLQKAVQCCCVIYGEKNKGATAQTSLDHFFQKGRQNWIQEGTRTCAIHIRREWSCSFPSISVLTLLQLSRLLSLLWSVSLPACSPSASPRVPAVAMYYYCTVKLNMFSLILTCFLFHVCFICICVKSILSLLLYSTNSQLCQLHI